MMVGTFCSWLTRFCFTILLLANLVTCTICTAEMTKANSHIFPLLSLNNRYFGSKLVQYDLGNFLAFPKFDILVDQLTFLEI